MILSSKRFQSLFESFLSRQGAGVGWMLLGPVCAAREISTLPEAVKPLALIKWLCSLVTPPGGTILDPFLGSGTTACAALIGGFNCIGIERDPTYFAIAQARVDYTRIRLETLKRLPKQQDLALTPPSTSEPAPYNIPETKTFPGLKLSPDRVQRLIRRASRKVVQKPVDKG